MDNRGYLCVSLLLISCLLRNVAGDLTANIFLRLYHRSGSVEDVNVRNAAQLVPKLDTNQPTVIFIHGFVESVQFADVIEITQAYLDYTTENTLALDYREAGLQIYTVSAELYERVGKLLAEGLNGMFAAGVSPSKLHLIGHSLGSQIAGAAGRNTVTKISRITGLDPAGPLFYIFNSHLTKNDAQFVDIIHTDMFIYGLGIQTGHVDFYPNFGHAMQPGCNNGIFKLLNGCNHHISYKFYVESVKEPQGFMGVKCKGDLEFIDNLCDTNDIVPMGYRVPRNATGKRYLQTNAIPPRGRGMNGTRYRPL